MRGRSLARVLHKWAGLIVGIQLLTWLVTGLYMVIVDLDFIHGDPLVRNMQMAVAVPDDARLTFSGLRTQFPDATQISLQTLMDKTFFLVTTADNRFLLDPISANVVSPLDETSARNIAGFHFNGDALIVSASLITSDPPSEIQTRRLPLWRIDFDDRFSTSFYIDPVSGKLVTRRHQYWRIFDFLWMLHIMDYDDRSNVHNLLLKIAQVCGLGFAITGIFLLFYSFGGRRRKAESR